MRVVHLFRSRDIILRLQSKRSGLLQSALILLAASFAADLFPLGLMAGTSLAWLICRPIVQSIAAVILVTRMWIVRCVLVNSLMKRKASPDFPVIRAVLILTIAVMVILNGLPHSNTSGGHSLGWPFRFIYGTSVISPFSGILDGAHALIVVALLLAVADRAIALPHVAAPTPPHVD